MLHTPTAADPGAPPPDTLSTMFVTRIWHLMDLRRLTAQDIHERTGIPMDTLFRLYNGDAELTADQLVHFCSALDVHVMAIFDGITATANLVPEELMDRGTAQLAARLHRLPKMGREMIMADVERRLANV